MDGDRWNTRIGLWRQTIMRAKPARDDLTCFGTDRLAGHFPCASLLAGDHTLKIIADRLDQTSVNQNLGGSSGYPRRFFNSVTHLRFNDYVWLFRLMDALYPRADAPKLYLRVAKIARSRWIHLHGRDFDPRAGWWNETEIGKRMLQFVYHWFEISVNWGDT